jgi:hypothetical protein
MTGATRAAAAAIAALLSMQLSGPAPAAEPPAVLALPAGARVGVVNLLDAELTHYHAAHRLQDSFLKTYAVSWPLHAMLMDAVTERLSQLGLAAVAIAPSEALRRAREECLLNGTPGKGLAKNCGPPFAQLAAAERVEALIVLAPGLNNSAHAGGNRRGDLPQYLRGWCLLSDGVPGSAPALLNLTELLLIAPAGGTAQIVAREWGGNQQRGWSSFTAPPDLRNIPAQQLEQLKPLFADMLKAQAAGVLGHLQISQ